MRAIALGKSSSCTQPVFQLIAIDPADGLLKDVISATFEIKDKNGTTTEGPTAVDLTDCPTGDRLGRGRYHANWTVPTTETKGAHTVTWIYDFVAAGPKSTYARDFEVLGSVKNPLARLYTSIARMRDEGIKPQDAKAERLHLLIELAGQYVEMFTGNVFEAVGKDMDLDGTGARAILLDEPIVAIGDVAIDTSPFAPSDLPIDPSLFRVYNRHIRQGLFHPDDRGNPKLEFFHPSRDRISGVARFSFDRLVFHRGEQNIRIEGVFGYTDPDGTLLGSTPVLIEQATALLVLRNQHRLTKTDEREDAQRSWQVTELRTRDQQIKYGFPDRGAAMGGFTGDPEIDNILARFTKPMAIAAV